MSRADGTADGIEQYRRDYPVIIELPVAWGDMDALGHVNNTVYFRYFESARIAYLERLGFAEGLRREDCGPILATASCRFRLALSYPDSVLAGARVTDIGSDRFNMQYAAYSTRHGRVAAEGEATVVTYDYRAGRKRELPAGLIEAIRRLQDAQR